MPENTAPSTLFGLTSLLRQHPVRIGITWGLVVIENALMALVPLLIGFAIDDLLQKQSDGLIHLGAIFVCLILVAVFRRVIDTRNYGKIRIALGMDITNQHQAASVSSQNARLLMGRELVDFLENDTPELFTASIQIVIAIIVLATFHTYLMSSAAVLLVLFLGAYSLFNQSFFNFNNGLNNQVEKQVGVLGAASRTGIRDHLAQICKWEIKLSDTEAALYGSLFLLIAGFILFNLWFSVSLPDISPGALFSVITYSWEFAESAIMLPVVLQNSTRLREISKRLNKEPQND